ncbi:hypothetical protein DFH07DRAFT_968398 [Mycena maculata]|uniref:Uncharacterized protein n=1 Tax=Mycena maculata TaxID=230809 RepID=A0AAD7I0S8_9AGAR|nr:hypothetical protein DFH07DRAFT_968398 [Mycena maculata]
MAQSRPHKRTREAEDARAEFDHDHWAQLRPCAACHEVVLYFDGSFQALEREEAIAVFTELEPAFVKFRQAEQAAVSHTDASAVEAFIFQVGVMFRSFEQMYTGFSTGRFNALKSAFIQGKPPANWLKETFRIPDVRTKITNPFDLAPSAFQSVSPPSPIPPPPKKHRPTQPAPEPFPDEDLPIQEDSPALRRSTRDPRPPPRGNYRAQNAEVVVETPAASSSKKAGKTRQSDPVPDSPQPTSKTHDESDDNSVQVIAKPSDLQPVETPGEFDPAAIEKANLRFKGKGSKVLGNLPPAPPIAPTVVAKHLVASAALPAEDARSLFPCYDCLSRGRICVYAGPRKRCYNCIKSGQTCTLRANSHQAMIALDRLEPILVTTSRRFNSHLKTITRTGRLVQLHQDLAAMHLQQYVDDLQEFAFEFFQAEKALTADHFNARFEDYEMQDAIRDLFAAFDITFESALEHFKSVNPVGTILEDETGDAKSVLPEAAQAHDEPNDPDADLSVDTPGPRPAPKSSVTGTAPVKFGPPKNVPRTDSSVRPQPNPFAREPRDLGSIGREASPFFNTLLTEAPTSPNVDQLNDNMGGGGRGRTIWGGKRRHSVRLLAASFKTWPYSELSCSLTVSGIALLIPTYRTNNLLSS